MQSHHHPRPQKGRLPNPSREGRQKGWITLVVATRFADSTKAMVKTYFKAITYLLSSTEWRILKIVSDRDAIVTGPRLTIEAERGCGRGTTKKIRLGCSDLQFLFQDIDKIYLVFFPSNRK